MLYMLANAPTHIHTANLNIHNELLVVGKGEKKKFPGMTKTV